MTVQIKPSKLKGTLPAVPSKSASHRALICAALAQGHSEIGNLIFSEDILATIDCLRALGAQITCKDNVASIEGIGEQALHHALLNCRESGSTLRFLIPVAAALGVNAVFEGSGKLPARPIVPYLDSLGKNGVLFHYQNTMPFSIEGLLSGGVFSVPGNISSQFITGLLFALPLLSTDSVIKITGIFESKPYVQMTLQMLKRFGISADLSNSVISVPGRQKYRPQSFSVEGDFSQAAFFLTAGAFGGPVTITGLDYGTSLQGDKKIVEFLKYAGASVEIEKDKITISQPQNGVFHPLFVDARDIPDLVPILAVLAGRSLESSMIYHAERLKIKESDRLQTTAALLKVLGVKVQPKEDGLSIMGTKIFQSCTAESFNDHRIAMSTAIAATAANGPVYLHTAEAVRKSYPNFYQDYQVLGGNINVINLE